MPLMLHDNAFVSPSTGPVGRLANRLVASRPLLRSRRALLSRLPFLQLASEVENVVYCTWLVDVAAVAHLVPRGVTLASRDGRTPFTIDRAHIAFGARKMPREPSTSWGTRMFSHGVTDSGVVATTSERARSVSAEQAAKKASTRCALRSPRLGMPSHQRRRREIRTISSASVLMPFVCNAATARATALR